MLRQKVDAQDVDKEDRHDLAMWRESKSFLEQFAYSLQIFDPLDRDIKGDLEENQAIKRDDLKKQLTQMTGISGTELSAPMSKNVSFSLEQLFEKQQQACAEVAS